MTDQETNKSSRIAVVGAGNMGSGIAQKYAMHGHQVIVVDKEHANVLKSEQSIAKSLEQGVVRTIFTADEASRIGARMCFTTEFDAACDADLVVEAIFENLSLKQELFGLLDKECAPSTILATNTSSLKVVDLQRGLKHPERVLGLHYFYPPARNRLVEIISTPQTSPDVALQALALQHTINKTVIHAKDSPGFIVNRFFVPWLNEALRIVHEGKATIATVDKAAQDFFHIGMGPFALMNATGLPITLHACDALARELGDFYAPNALIVPQIEKHAAWDISGDADETMTQAIGLRLLAIVSSLSCQMVFDERVGTAQDVDVGAQVGLMWKRGPFAMMAEYRGELVRTLASMKAEGLLLPSTLAFEKFQ